MLAAASPEQYVSHLNHALGLFQSNSIFTLGQNNIVPGLEQCNNNITADIRANVTVACPAAQLTIPGVEDPVVAGVGL
jgi:hypothetical protein